MVHERRTILYSGRVQGMGFRWTALQAMEGLAVTGYVRNLRDGRVELLVEGDPTQTQSAADRVRSAMASLISTEDERIAEATGQFEDLSIRR